MVRPISADVIHSSQQAVDNTVRLANLEASGESDINLRRTTEAVTHSSYIGGVHHFDVKLTTLEDRYLSANRRESVTLHESNSTIKRYLDKLNPIIQKGSDDKSRIVEDYNRVLTDATRFGDQPDLKRNNFTHSVQRFTTSCNNLLDKIQGFRLEAHTEINEKIDNLNSHIKELQQINAKMVNRADLKSELIKQRDSVTDKIAKYLAIDVSYNQYEQVTIQAGGFSAFLVKEGASYVQFDKIAQLSNEQILNNEGSKMVYNTYDSNQQKGMAITENNISSSIIKGGELGALIEVRDVMLKESHDNVASLHKEIASKFNFHHNKHSPFPPKTSFFSTQQINPNSEVSWAQKDQPLTFYGLDKTGKQLSSGYDMIKPAEIDLSKVRSTSGTAKPTYKDLLKEVNYQLDGKYNKPRASLGEFIKGSNNGDTDSNYSINDFGIVGTHNIDSGRYEFEFEMEGNSFHGSTVEIVGMSGPLGPQPSENMPNSFRVEKAGNYRSEKPFTMQGVAGGSNSVTFEVRVTGDNGKVSYGSVSFDIDTSLDNQTNIRPKMTGVTGDFAVASSGSTGIATVKLVDQNGINLGLDSGKDGHLLLETNDDEYRLAFSGSMFGEAVGMNDMFIYDEASGHINLREDIASDHRLLSTGQIKMSESFDKEFTVGDKKANMQLTFGGAAIAAGDTITVGGQIFTFVAGLPANENEVSIAGNSQVNFANALNNHSIIKHKLTTSFDAGTMELKMEALEAGLDGNKIEISAVFLGGATVQHQGKAATGLLMPTSLIGGTDKIEISKLRQFSVGESSDSFFESIDGLKISQSISLSDSRLYRQINDAEKDNEISSGQVKLINEEFSRKMVKNKSQLMRELAQFLTHLKSTMTLSSKLIEFTDTIQTIVMGR